MKTLLSLLVLITLAFSTVAPVAKAEDNSATCLCKCSMHWFSSRITVTPASVGLGEDASKYDVEARSGVACKNYCESSEQAKYGRVMNFGYSAGVCF